MMTEGWRYAFTSVVGTSHIRDELPCQDASDCQVLHTQAGTPVLVALVADGAGSARHSAEGAQLACTLLCDEIATLLDTGGAIEELTRDFVVAWLTHFQHAIAERAEGQGCAAREFACTLLAAIVGEESGVFFQVGDGAIVVADRDEPDEYGWIFWPQRGEYENMTMFITDPRAADYLEHEIKTWRYAEIALFTDGLQRLALHFASMSVHNPFFRPIFPPLRAQQPGYLPDLSAALARFLDSPIVNGRTDDDKTLVLATRRNDEDSLTERGTQTREVQSVEAPSEEQSVATAGIATEQPEDTEDDAN
jgi:hypothetical protein